MQVTFRDNLGDEGSIDSEFEVDYTGYWRESVEELVEEVEELVENGDLRTDCAGSELVLQVSELPHILEAEQEHGEQFYPGP